MYFATQPEPSPDSHQWGVYVCAGGAWHSNL